MSKEQWKPIKQCILIAETLTSDFLGAEASLKVGCFSPIELSISWLAEHGVGEILVCHSSQKEHLRGFYEAMQKNCESKLHLVFMHPDSLRNLGEVMRHVHFLGVISEEFMVMHGDTVTNLDLGKVLGSHQRRKKELKNVVMTAVMQQGGEDRLLHIMDQESGEVLQINQDGGEQFRVNSDRVKLKKMNVQFRRDLSYCDIYICHLDVLNSFKEIQDYSTMFDYIEAMLTSDVFDEKIVAYTLDQAQLSYRTNTAKGYYLAHINFVSRHFYPYTLWNRAKFPKWIKLANLPYFESAFNRVLSNSAEVKQKSSISCNCYVGDHTEVAKGVSISKSIIGSHCVIEENSWLRNCIILDHCLIKKGSRYENCLIQKVQQIQHVTVFGFPAPTPFLVQRPLFQEDSFHDEGDEDNLSLSAHSSSGPTHTTAHEDLLESQLQNMMAEDPELEIVTELYTVRKRLNKNLEDFTRTMIKVKNPQGVKGVQSFTEDWGHIIALLHDKSDRAVIQSLYSSCRRLPEYEKAFNIFLQYFYMEDHLTSFNILKWFKEKKMERPECPILQKCHKFIQQLQEEEDEEDDGEDEESDSE